MHSLCAPACVPSAAMVIVGAMADSENASIHCFRVTEGDLETLESELPRLLSSNLMACNDPLTRKRWEAIKTILSNIRWDYGPPCEVGTIPAGPEE